MHMTDGEICRNYRGAKNRSEQIQILAELNDTGRDKIIRILLQNGEKVRIPLPSRGKPRKQEMTDEEYYAALFNRLDVLDVKIAKLEREYRDIVAVLKAVEEMM